MKYTLNEGCRRFVALAVLLCGAGVAQAASTFQKLSTDYVQDFSTYTLGSTLTDNSWTASGAPFMTIGTPASGGSAQGQVVKLDSATTARIAMSPSLDFSPGYKLGDTIFLSAEIRATDDASSGVAIGLRNSDGQDVAFVRMRNSNPAKSFIMKGPAPSSWIQSDQRGDSFVWYEVLLAIELDAEDITKSTGSLFVRDLSLGSVALTAVADLQQINLGFTNTQNPFDIDQIRIELAGASAEFGNIQIGRGAIVIPEPAHVGIIMGVSMVALVCSKRR